MYWPDAAATFLSEQAFDAGDSPLSFSQVSAALRDLARGTTKRDSAGVPFVRSLGASGYSIGSPQLPAECLSGDSKERGGYSGALL
jgi:hypothetical protein